VEAFELYYRQLIAWNERVNLTAITDCDEVQVKHFLDSLSCLQVLPSLASETRCIDIGAGAGFPGLPLKIVRSQARLTLLEATGKKALFLEHIVDELGLREVQIVRGRAEELGRQPAFRESYHVALARAVGHLAVLLEYALPLLTIGGVFVAQKGEKIEGEVETAQGAMEILGGRVKEVRAVQLPGLEASRYLVVVEKVVPTPQKYPRRVGIPVKRPLTGT
jgi:16S rRNA (guanine527-N7)-methyltransferase